MFERFTDRARKVMALANQEAQRFNHEYIGTEHILLGLVRENQGVASRILLDCGVDAVGFEARGHGKDASHEAPATVLNSLMDITAAGGALGIPGLYVTGDPGGIDDKVVRLVVRDLPRHITRQLDHKQLREFRRRALHFHQLRA